MARVRKAGSNAVTPLLLAAAEEEKDEGDGAGDDVAPVGGHVHREQRADQGDQRDRARRARARQHAMRDTSILCARYVMIARYKDFRLAAHFDKRGNTGKGQVRVVDQFFAVDIHEVHRQVADGDPHSGLSG